MKMTLIKKIKLSKKEGYSTQEYPFIMSINSYKYHPISVSKLAYTQKQDPAW